MAVNPATYIKNLGKSIAYSSLDVASNYIPAGTSLVESNQEIFKEVYKSIKQPKGSILRLQKFVKNSKVYEAAEIGLKSTIEDLSTGQFYNKERISRIEDKASGGLTDFGDMDFNFDDFDSDFDFESDDVNDGDKYIGSIVKEASMAEASAISSTIAKSSKYIGEVQKSSTALMYNLNLKGFETVNTGIGSINQNMGQLLEFTTKTVKDYMEKSLKNSDKVVKYMEEQTVLLKQIHEIQSMLKPKQETKKSSKKTSRRFSDLTDANGILNVKDYAKATFDNIMKQSGLSSLMGMQDAFGSDANLLAMFAASPLKFITDAAVKKMIPKSIDKALTSFNETLSGFFATNLAKITSAGKFADEESGILGLIGKYLGIDNKLKTTVSPGTYTKGPVPFDGITRKAIIEVIPGHLARIEAAITGGKERIYDFNKGKWTDKQAIKAELKSIIDDGIMSAVSDTTNAIKDIFKEGLITFGSAKEEQEFWDAYRTFQLSRGKTGRFFNPKGKLEGSDFGISDDQLQLIARVYNSIFTGSDRGKLFSENKNLLEAIDRISSKLNTEEESGNSLFALLEDGSGDINKYDKKGNIKKGTTLLEQRHLINQTDEYKKNVFYYLRETLRYIIQVEENTSRGYGGGGSSPRNRHLSGRRNLKSSFESNILGSKIRTEEDFERTRLEREEEAYQRKIDKYTKLGIKNNIDPILLGQLSDPSNTEEDTERIMNKIDIAIRSAKNRLKDKDNTPDSTGLLASLFGDGSEYKNVSSLFGNVKYYSSKPARWAESLITRLDKRLYDITFGGTDELFTIDGKSAKSLLQVAALKIDSALGYFKEKMDEYLLGPLKETLGANSVGEFISNTIESLTGHSPREWGKIFKDKLFDKDKGIFPNFTEEFKGVFREAFDWTKGAFKDAYGPIGGFFKSDNPESDTVERYDRTTGELISVSKSRISSVGQRIKALREKNKNQEMERTALQNYADHFDDINGHAKGARFINKTGLAVLSEGEMVIPQHLNPFYKGERTTLQEQKRKESMIKNSFLGKFASSVGSKLPTFAEGTSYVPKFAKGSSSVSIPEGITEEQWMNEFTEEERREYLADNVIEATFRNVYKESSKYFKALFGDPKDVKIETANAMDDLFTKAMSDIGGNLSKYVPRGLAGALMGGGASLFTGGLISPFLGAAIGGSIAIAKDSQATKDWLFGSEDEKGEWKDGLIPKKTLDGLRKYIPSMAKGGAVGAITAMMPFVPGGPLVGLLVGSTAGYLSKNEEFQKTIFGEDFAEKKGKFQDKVKKTLPKILGGAGLGAAAGLVLGGPFGLVGNMVLGGGLGFLSSTNKFQDIMFGKEVNGERQGGLLGEVRKSIVDPLRGWLKKQGNALREWTQKNILNPIKEAFQPITKQMNLIVKGFVNLVADKIGGIFNKHVGIPLHRFITEHFVEPFKKVFKPLFSIAKLPFKAVFGGAGHLIGGVGNRLRRKHIKTGNADYMSAQERIDYRIKHGMRLDDTMSQFDQAINVMNSDELSELMTGFNTIKTTLRKDKNIAAQSHGDLLGTLEGVMGSEDTKIKDIKRLAKLAEEGKFEEAYSLLEKTPNKHFKKLAKKYSGGRIRNLSDKDKEHIMGIINSKGAQSLEDINTKKQNYQTSYDTLLKAFGGDRKAVEKALKSDGRGLDKYMNLIKKEKGSRDPVEERVQEERRETSSFRDNLQSNMKEIIRLLSLTPEERAKEQLEVRKLEAEALQGQKGREVLKAEEHVQQEVETVKRKVTRGKSAKIQTHIKPNGKVMKFKQGSNGELEPDISDKETVEEIEEEENERKSIKSMATSLINSNKTLSSIMGFFKGKKGGDGDDEDDSKLGLGTLIKTIFGGVGKWLAIGGGAIALLGTETGQKILGTIGKAAAELIPQVAGVIVTVLEETIPSLVKNIGTWIKENWKNFAKGFKETASKVLEMVGLNFSEEVVVDESGNVLVDPETGEPMTQEVGQDSQNERTEYFGSAIANFARTTMKKINKAKRGLGIKVKSSKVAKFFGEKIGNFGDKLLNNSVEKATKEAATGAAQAAGKGVAKAATTETTEKLTTRIIKAVTDKMASFINHHVVAKYLGKEGAEALMKKGVPAIIEAIPGFVAKASGKVIASVSTAGLFNVAMAVYGFLDGMTDARRILGIKETPTAGQRVIAGIISAINEFILLGLIPEHIIVNLILDPLAEGLGIADELRRQREEFKDFVDEYNKENGTDLSVKEYQDEVLNLDGSIYDRIKKTLTTPKVRYQSSTIDRMFAGGLGTGIRYAGMGGGHETPVLSQNDPRVANKKFGNSTIGEAGCAPSAVATFLNQQLQDVDINDTARYALKYQNSNGAVDARYFNDVFSRYGYNANYTENKREAFSRIKNGESMIILGRLPGNRSKMVSPFASTPHYIIANEITKDGQVIINDPETGKTGYYDQSILNQMQLAIGANKNFSKKLKEKANSLRDSVGKGTRYFGFGTDNSNERVVYEFLINEMGINTAAACGVLANIQAESGFSSGAEGDKGYANGSSIGICQWREGRLANLKNFCAQNNKSYLSLDGQLWYMKYELENVKDYSKTLNAMHGATNNSQGAYNVAYTWCVNFERPKHKETKGAQRGQTARQFWEKYRGEAVEANSSISSRAIYNGSGELGSGVAGIVGESGESQSFFSQLLSGFSNLLSVGTIGGSSTASLFGGTSSVGDLSMAGTVSGDASSARDWFKQTLSDFSGVNSEFGPRIHPISGEYKNHAGIDIGSSKKTGATIYTPVSGTVTKNESISKGYGNNVRITDNSGGEHIFAHMLQKSPLAVGTKVTKGQAVGQVGSTGASTGPHLHYEVRQGGKPVNPDNYLAQYTGGGTGAKRSPLKQIAKDKFEGMGGVDQNISAVSSVYQSIISILVQMLDGTNAISDIRDLLYDYFKAEKNIASGKNIEASKKQKSAARDGILSSIQQGGTGESSMGNPKKQQLLNQLKLLMTE